MQLKKVNELPHSQLCSLLDGHGHSELKLSVRESGYLSDFVALLQPFYQATQLTQGEKVSIVINLGLS